MNKNKICVLFDEAHTSMTPGKRSPKLEND